MFEQDRAIVRLQQRVLQETEIQLCFLTGSYGRRKEDAYSDLDVLLVYANEERRAAAFLRRREFVQSVLPYVPAKSFDAGHIRPYLHIALYSNGTKADYLFETRDSLEPSPWLREVRVLKDTADGWGAAFQAKAAQQPVATPTAGVTVETLTDLDNRFWVMFWDSYRLLLRGDHDKPFTIYLEFMFFTLPELLRLLPAESPAYQGLIQAEFSHNTTATAVHMRRLFTAYLAARDAIIQRHHLAFTPNRAFETAVQRLIEKG
jgi:predicted nucleotidyltransferase